MLDVFPVFYHHCSPPLPIFLHSSLCSVFWEVDFHGLCPWLADFTNFTFWLILPMGGMSTLSETEMRETSMYLVLWFPHFHWFHPSTKAAQLLLAVFLYRINTSELWAQVTCSLLLTLQITGSPAVTGPGMLNLLFSLSPVTEVVNNLFINSWTLSRPSGFLLGLWLTQ